MGNTVAHSFFRSTAPCKRKASTDQEYEEENAIDIFCPKRRKVMSTTKYIYKTLFEEGQGSDVKITALNRSWDLHRLYLSQSPYFNSMFNGLWVETTQKEIHIGIEDDNITSEALHKVFGSLYTDEIQILPLEAVSILASATLLQLDDLIQQSIEVMKDSINIDTVFIYSEASDLYGLPEIRNISVQWLHKNTLLTIALSPKHLQQISCDLITELVSSPELVVTQTEISLYLLLKQWVYLKQNPDCSFDNLSTAVDEFFKENNGGTPYLLTENGIQYQKAFCALRLRHLVSHHMDMELIETDNIIPGDWFVPIFRTQWLHMLKVDQGVDKGPKQVNEEEFKKNCVRCGRVLNTDTQHSWRWTGYNFGFDIVITYFRGAFKLKRFQRLESESRCSSEPLSPRVQKRHLMYRLRAYSLGKNGKVISEAETRIGTVSLKENESVTVLVFKSEMKFPLVLSANFLLTTPLQTTDGTRPTTRLH